MSKIQSKTKLISITEKLFTLFGDSEMLFSTGKCKRADVVVLKMKFQGQKIDFAIPWRSNLKKGVTSPKSYFNLPNTTKTQSNHIACLDFHKAFPLPKKNPASSYYGKYHVVESKDAYTLLVIDNRKKELIKAFQEYLDNYCNIPSNVYHVDICKCIDKLKKENLL